MDIDKSQIERIPEFGDPAPMEQVLGCSVDEFVFRQAEAICAPYTTDLRSLLPAVTKHHFELMSALALSRKQSIKWCVNKVFPEKGIAAIYGAPGSAKSFLALDLAMSIASGKDWFGRRTSRAPVVFLCLEGEGGLPQRLKAIESRHSLHAEVSFVTTGIDILSQSDLTVFRSSILGQQPDVGVLIIDTLNRSAPGLDENSSVDMGNAIRSIKYLQSALDCLVILVHHSGKDAGRGLRGHSSLIAALDAAIEVKREGSQRSWSLSKSKDGNDGDSFAFELDQVVIGLDVDGEVASSCVVSPKEGAIRRVQPLTPSQKFGLDSFSRACRNGDSGGQPEFEAQLEDWRAEFYRSSTAESGGAKRKAFNRARKELVDLGKLTVIDDVYSLPSGPNFDARQGTKAGQERDTSRTNSNSERDERDTPL